MAKNISLDDIIPEKRKYIPTAKARTARQEWETFAHDALLRVKREAKRRLKPSLMASLDLENPYIKRRINVMLDQIDYIYQRCTDIPDHEHFSKGEEWIALNLMHLSYSSVEAQYHVLYGAALWILDHISIEKAYQYLPTDPGSVDSMDLMLWDTQYDIDLINSVLYVLEHRNGLPELLD